MKIINTYLEIVSLTNKMNGDFDMKLYESYLNGISSELSEKVKYDSRHYNFNGDILPVLKLAMTDNQKLEAAHISFLKAVDGLSQRVEKIIGTELHVDIIFYLGLCNGAGWATELNDKSVILLGVEKIIELGWYGLDDMTALIYHELGHVWHKSVVIMYEEARSERERYILQLYQEGIAMYFEQLVLSDFNYYHQNKNDWLHWCISNKHTLNIEYLRRLEADESAQDFFWDWCNYKGYSDVGYFLGCEFVKEISNRYSLNELAKLDIHTIYKEFREYVG